MDVKKVEEIRNLLGDKKWTMPNDTAVELCELILAGKVCEI
jgi:hypothetical protein